MHVKCLRVQIMGTIKIEQEWKKGGRFMFEKGDYVVYGTKGVCQVEEITELDMKGTAEGRLYYVLRPCFQKGSTVFTPVDSDKTAMRAVMSEEEASALVEGISGIEALLEKNDKEREKRYKEAICSGDPRQWIRIIKTSYLRGQERIAQGKKATTIDERYFHAAEEQLYEELSIALGVPKENMREYIGSRAGSGTAAD